LDYNEYRWHVFSPPGGERREKGKRERKEEGELTNFAGPAFHSAYCDQEKETEKGEKKGKEGGGQFSNFSSLPLHPPWVVPKNDRKKGGGGRGREGSPGRNVRGKKRKGRG